MRRHALLSINTWSWIWTLLILMRNYDTFLTQDVVCTVASSTSKQQPTFTVLLSCFPSTCLENWWRKLMNCSHKSKMQQSKLNGNRLALWRCWTRNVCGPLPELRCSGKYVVAGYTCNAHTVKVFVSHWQNNTVSFRLWDLCKIVNIHRLQ